MMRISFLIIPALAVAAPAAARPAEAVRCVVDGKPPVACRMQAATRKGVRDLRFDVGGRQIRFVGRAQSGWWSGTLDGKPAMGFERNRGHVVFSTTDMTRTFAWFYPAEEHGTY